MDPPGKGCEWKEAWGRGSGICPAWEAGKKRAFKRLLGTSLLCPRHAESHLSGIPGTQRQHNESLRVYLSSHYFLPVYFALIIFEMRVS
jgi:hypothetical protein